VPFHLDSRRYTFKKGHAVLSSQHVSRQEQVRWFEDELLKSDVKEDPLHASPDLLVRPRPRSDMPLRSALEPILIGQGVDVVLAGYSTSTSASPQHGIQYSPPDRPASCARGTSRRARSLPQRASTRSQLHGDGDCGDEPPTR
jgi:hypothetical protein